jgi:hypothetical protein
MMERSAIIPHISWSGPQPERETDAYLLAMLLRIHETELDEAEPKRDLFAHPSVLTTENMQAIAIMYAFYKERMEETGARNAENMLRLIKEMENDCVTKWLPGSMEAIRRAEAELIEYVETPAHKGFTAFG